MRRGVTCVVEVAVCLLRWLRCTDVVFRLKLSHFSSELTPDISSLGEASSVYTRIAITATRLHDAVSCSTVLGVCRPDNGLSRREPTDGLTFVHGTSNASIILPMLISLEEEGCWQVDECSNGRCPCPQNLKGWCEMNGGIQGADSWFSRWDTCVVRNCPDDGDITSELLPCTAEGSRTDDGRSHVAVHGAV